MLIPIGLDQDTVRRWPWITIGLVVVNIMVFLSSLMGSGAGSEEEIGRRLQAVVEYWQEHPYLEVPEALRPESPSAMEKERFDTMVEAMRQLRGGLKPDDPAELEAQQEEFRRLGQRFKDALEAHPFKRWGLEPAHPRPLAFLTSMFIHGGWLHLFGNLLILWLAGPFVEDAFGRPLFSALYLFSGVVSAGLHVLAFPDSVSPLGGASGAIAGVMGAFLIRYAFVKIRFFYWFGLIFRGTFDAPAWLMLPLWLLQQVFFASMDTDGKGGVAYWAHIGGFVFGAAIALAVKQTRLEERYIAPAIEAQISITQHPALDEGMHLMSQGSFVAARESLAVVLQADPRHPDANLAVWQCFVQERNPGGGVDYLARVIEDELKHDEPGLAFERWRELVAESGVGGPGPLRWRLAAALEGLDRDAAVDVLQQLANDPGAGLLTEKAARKLDGLGIRVEAPRPVGPPPAALPAVVARPVPAWSPPAATPPVVERQVAVPPPLDSAAFEGVPAPTPYLGLSFEVEEYGIISAQEDGLVLSGGSQGGTELLPFFALRGLAVAGISAQPRAYLLLDMLLKPEAGMPAKVVRLRSTEFDPRKILNRPDLNPLAAFKELVAGIARLSGATVWPENLFAEGSRFTTFPEIEAYEAQVLTALCEE